MKQGDVLHGYDIVTKPTNDNAGKCVWAFAVRDGREYFIKEFLDPKRPRPGGMGDENSKRLRLAHCEEFEERHWSVINRIDPTDREAGNLVTATDFFCEGTKYYKVTARLHPVVPPAPQELSARQKVVLLGTLGHSLALLHRLDIVHGDLKPQNVLLHRPSGSDLYTAKLIDFDDAYVSGRPPSPDLIGGDLFYAAPELVRYLLERAPPGELTVAADMFAFGLMTHGYLTGVLPGFDRTHHSAAEAIGAGASILLDRRLSRPVAALIRAMLAVNPAHRPKASEALTVLAEESTVELVIPPAARLRGSLTGGGTARPVTPAPLPLPPGRRSRLRINLDDRR
ncbi:protein kinase domain-containing protein [Amycolatopsis sp. H20-H5]|uniref:protein kinase domain-containing protein n=1 Tax=Amycolatopsis sp. H20-H5 TaxID=3046309 RepID=UPI002DBF8387|nr:protein kinase [Amycolatopsis sp. H20-H5]MEC3975719.1 protein kinase [Amycolatopsis sp. H20-H5]